MKVQWVILGSNHTAALERYYLRHLLKDGMQADIFPIQQYYLEYYHASILHKALVRSGLSNIYNRINTRFCEYVEKISPEVVWIFKGIEVLPTTIKWLKERNITVINFNPDNPYIFSGRGSGNKNVSKAIKLFDHYFSYDSDTVRQLREESIPASLLPFGHDVEDDFYMEISSSTIEKVKPCFLGLPDKFRSKFITNLAHSGIEIDCYGDRWNQWVNHKNIQCFPSCYGNEFWKTLYRYRVQLNYMRPHNLNSHNMRTFEIPAIGGIQLAPRTKDHVAFFKEGQEIFLYDSLDECCSKINALLDMNADQSELIRKRARKKCIEAEYSYSFRTKQVIATIAPLLKSVNLHRQT